MSRRRVVVCGGAGFLGSVMTAALVEQGDHVVVIDGLMPESGGTEANLAHLKTAIQLIAQPVERVAALKDVLAGSSVIVDCMGWTRHKAAFEQPFYDQQLNLGAHLHLIEAARRVPGARILYVGSRGEYGKPTSAVITEDTPLVPTDVQSVHKAAADHLLRIYSALDNLPALSLRIPNSYGPGQPVVGKDVGLVGEWIRTALAGGDIVLYGTGRRRSLLYSGDVAQVVATLCREDFSGYHAFNLAGRDVDLADLAHRIVRIAGRGAVRQEPMPHEIAVMDIGDARFDDGALRARLGALPAADLDAALARTITYFKERLQ